MASEDVKLAICPFCGADASAEGVVTYSDRQVEEQSWSQSMFYFCNCPHCGVNNRGLVGHKSREDAIAAWNRRTAQPVASAAPADREEALEEALRLLSADLDRDRDQGEWEGGYESALEGAIETIRALKDKSPPAPQAEAVPTHRKVNP